MKATIKLDDGRELTINVSEEDWEKLKKTAKKTGYEWVKDGVVHYIVQGDGCLRETHFNAQDEDAAYLIANYYSAKTVAENNARADTLMRKLRRFAVEHREYELDWNDTGRSKYTICYSVEFHNMIAGSFSLTKSFGEIHFDTRKAAEAAIEEFEDELLWYFTEYKDSL